jgi:peptide/nickel transport system substrate-binding protein
VSTTRRSTKFAALAVGLALIAAACGGDDETTTTEAPGTTEASTETTAEAAPETTEGTEETTPETTAPPAADAAMTITYDINPDAVWDDGTPITAADFECTWQANLNTPGSIGTAGYDLISAVAAGESDKQVVVSFTDVYAPYKGLFGGLIKKDAVADCNDISEDFGTELPFSGLAYKIDSWSEEQVVLVPNENWYGDAPANERIVMVPRSENIIQALLAGEVDFIYPQYYAGITDELADPNVQTQVEYGGDYEAMYMNLGEGLPFSDPALREAFYKSIDLDALFAQIYTPIAPEGTLLTCGPIVPGRYCPEGIFGNKFDQAAADQIMTDAGYAKDGEGLWAKDGAAPEIRWMINSGNTRRESTQEYLIPLLRAAGFNVVADNCEAECVFQQRLPAADYDLAMYISTAPPDPAYLTPSFSGLRIPTEENGFAGQNFQNWNNEVATAALEEADKTIDDAAREELIKSAIVEMDTDYVLIPLFQFPKSGAWRTDRTGGTVGDELNNFQAFNNFATWDDVDGDGQIIIGAEQWPGCLNPVTECANSSWYVWTVANPVLPGVYATTNDAQYALTSLMASEPVVEVAG